MWPASCPFIPEQRWPKTAGWRHRFNNSLTCGVGCRKVSVLRRPLNHSDSSDSLKLSPNPTAKLCLPPSLPQQAHDLSGRPFVCSLSCLSLGRWVAGPWSPCSATCEKGIQHREVTCVYQLQNGTHVATRPLYCPVPRPSPVQSCEGQDCLSIWEASEWSQVGAWAALGPCLQGPQMAPFPPCCL